MRPSRLVAAAVVASQLCSAVAGDTLFAAAGLETPQDFIVVMDAGSTGTRANVFQFPQRVHRSDHFPIIVSEPLTLPHLLAAFTTHPGISSFAHRIHDLRANLLPIIQDAAASVQAFSHGQNISDIPIYLGATAGMRALGDEVRDEVMAEIRRTLASPECPFAFRMTEQARVLAGEEEGAFGWLTANALAGTLSSDPLTTFGTLDMGGASAQVSFVPTEPSVLANMFPMHFGHFRNGPIHLYTHSYQEYGYVHAFRRSARLLLQEGQESVDHPCLPRGLRWQVDSEHFGIGADPERAAGPIHLNGTGNFDECRALARSIIMKVECTTEPCAILGVYQPKLNVSKFVLLGEFETVFDRMGIPYHDRSAPPLATLTAALAEWCPMTVQDLGRANAEELGAPGGKLELACWLGMWSLEFLTYGVGMPSETLFGPGPYSWTLGQAIYEVNFFPYRILDVAPSDQASKLQLLAEAGGPTSIQAGVTAAAVGAALVLGSFVGVAAERRRTAGSRAQASPLLSEY